jgi:hypothetical protein
MAKIYVKQTSITDLKPIEFEGFKKYLKSKLWQK